VKGRLGSVNATANASQGMHLSTRVARGTHVTLKNGKLRLFDRWNAGPNLVNLSKSGLSGSYKNGAGSYNFIKLGYSSFKWADIQLRVKKAVQLQLLYIAVLVVLGAVKLAFNAVFILGWLAWLVLSFVLDLVASIASQILGREQASLVRADHHVESRDSEPHEKKNYDAYQVC